MMSKSKTTIHLSDQAKLNIDTIRSHVGELTQNAAIETALAFYAAFLKSGKLESGKKNPRQNKQGGS